MRQLIVNTATVVAVFSLSVWALFFVMMEREPPLVDGQSAALFVASLPGDMDTVDIFSEMHDAADVSGVTMVKRDYRDIEDDAYFYIGKEPEEKRTGYFDPEFDPVIRPIITDGTVDPGGSWLAYSSADGGFDELRSRLSAAGVMIDLLDNGEWYVPLIKAAERQLPQAALLLAAFVIAANIYVGARHENQCQVLSVLGWSRRRTIVSILRKTWGHDAVIIAVLICILLVCLAAYNGLAEWDVVMAVVAAVIGAGLIVQTMALLAGLGLNAWWPRTRSISTTAAVGYRAALLCQAAIVVFTGLIVGTMPRVAGDHAYMTQYEEAWRESTDRYRLVQSAVVQSMDAENRVAADERLVSFVNDRISEDTAQIRFPVVHEYPTPFLVADASIASDLGVPLADISDPVVLVPRDEVDVSDPLRWVNGQRQLIGASPLHHARIVTYQPGREIATWTSGIDGREGTFDESWMKDPVVLVVQPGRDISADGLAAAASQGAVTFREKDASELWLSLDDAGLAPTVNRVVPVSQRPLEIIAEGKSELRHTMIFICCALLVGVLTAAMTAALHEARRGRADAIMTVLGWPGRRLVVPEIGVVSIAGAMTALVSSASEGTVIAAFYSLLSTGLMGVLLVALLNAGMRRNLASRLIRD